ALLPEGAEALRAGRSDRRQLRTGCDAVCGVCDGAPVTTVDPEQTGFVRDHYRNCLRYRSTRSPWNPCCATAGAIRRRRTRTRMDCTIRGSIELVRHCRSASFVMTATRMMIISLISE